MSNLGEIHEFHGEVLRELPCTWWMKPWVSEPVGSWSGLYLQLLGDSLPMRLRWTLSSLDLLSILPWEERPLVEGLLAHGPESATYEALEKLWRRLGEGLSRRDRCHVFLRVKAADVSAYANRGGPKARNAYLAAELARRDMPGRISSESRPYAEVLHRGYGERWWGAPFGVSPYEVASSMDDSVYSPGEISEEMIIILEKLLDEAECIAMKETGSPGLGEWGQALQSREITFPYLMRHLEHLTPEKIATFNSLVDEYNLEWSMASYDWSDGGGELRVRETLRGFVDEHRASWALPTIELPERIATSFSPWLA